MHCSATAQLCSRLQNHDVLGKVVKQEKQYEINNQDFEEKLLSSNKDENSQEKTIMIQDKKNSLNKTLIKSKSLSKPITCPSKHFSAAEKIRQ